MGAADKVLIIIKGQYKMNRFSWNLLFSKYNHGKDSVDIHFKRNRIKHALMSVVMWLDKLYLVWGSFELFWLWLCAIIKSWKGRWSIQANVGPLTFTLYVVMECVHLLLFILLITSFYFDMPISKESFMIYKNYIQ